MAGLADRHRALDGGADAREAIRQIFGFERQAHRVHAAADVDADRRRYDRALGGNDRAHGRTDAVVRVRHGRDVMMNERQLRDVRELGARLVRDVVGVDLDGHPALAENLLYRHVLLSRQGLAWIVFVISTTGRNLVTRARRAP
jgi:hypothetical protein